MKVRNLIVVACVLIVLALSASAGFAQEADGVVVSDRFYLYYDGVVYGDRYYMYADGVVYGDGGGWADIGYGAGVGSDGVFSSGGA